VSSTYVGTLTRGNAGQQASTCLEPTWCERAPRFGFTLGEIYRAQYPPKLGLPDTLEAECLVDQICGRFRVPEDVLLELWQSEGSLSDLVSACIAARRGSSARGGRP
jgi:hypothetical protein